MTDDAQSTSPSTAEPTSEQPTVVTAATTAAETPPPPVPPAAETPPAVPPAAETPPPALPVAEKPPPGSPPLPPTAEPQSDSSTTGKVAALLDERPELGAGGAFAGGIVFALILKRLGR